MVDDDAGIVEWMAFETGDRVRVRLSPECPWSHDPKDHNHPGIVDHKYRSGVIENRNRGHDIAVHLAGDFASNGLPRYTYFAAAELEPLETHDA